MTAVTQLRSKRFNGYLRTALPSELDTIVDSVVNEYRLAQPPARERTLNELGERSAGVLTVYGERMAAIAVRMESPEPLKRGLIGVGMGVGVLMEPYDTLISLAAINHSAQLLGTSLAGLTADLAQALPPAARSVFEDFAARSDRDKSLHAMRLGTTGSGPTFRYVPA
ncbi:hypothetical protein P8605_02435 [Streptomyces sp. T-3]|nr:hypothetical protein [Streptomyces sp. T-3]